MAEQYIPPPTITVMKIPIIRKGEYDIWSMRMRKYICHTNHNLRDVIVNGDLEEEHAPTGETSAPPAPKTAKQLAAKRNQERVKSILLLAIPDEYLLKFYNVADAKSLWEAIKSRFRGNEESKMIQENVLKHQFENFSTASNESLDKAYDRFQKLISQLEVHGAPISKKDINQKFVRSLPPSWNQIALIMRNKSDIDEIDIDDLYNNLRVYEDEMKRSSSSTSTSQNLAFLSSENTSSTNEVSTASGDFRVSTAGGISQVSSTICAHDIDEDDLEELDLRWQCYNCHRKGHFARKCKSGRNQGRRSYGDNGRSNAPTNESSSQALVAQDGLGGYDWSNDFEVKPVNYALMAISFSSSSSSSDNEVQKCSKQCLESFKTLQKNYDSEREKHSKAKLEIQGYELALESLKSRVLVHEKNELAWGEKYEFQNYKLKCREIKINNLNLELEKVVKEKDESSDEENIPANDMFSKADWYHGVPSLITGNFLTLKADISFTSLDKYAIRKKIIESKTTNLNTKTSKTVDQSFISSIKSLPYHKTSFYNPIDLKQDVKTFGFQNMTTAGTRAVVNIGKVDHSCSKGKVVMWPKRDFLDHTVVDSGCSSHMTGTKLIFQTMKISMEALWLLEVIPKELLCMKVKLYLELQKDVVSSLELKVTLIPYGGKSPSISFMRPFGCPLTTLNTLDSLGKFDGKYDEDQPNVAGAGPSWMFNLDILTNSMNYIPVSVENQVNVDAGTQDSYVAGSLGKD
ncbi:ribonuclease H-like domain-containing protein [Tanacetum coccineum]